MGFLNLFIIGWLEQGTVKMKVGCPTHKSDALRAASLDGGVLLVCSQAGCPIGEWTDEAGFEKDMNALRERLRVTYLEPPPNR